VIKKIEAQIRHNGRTALFHDSRRDDAELAKAINLTIVKINELIEVVNTLTEAQNEKR